MDLHMVTLLLSPCFLLSATSAQLQANVYTLPYTQPSSCSSMTDFFNTASLQCQSCFPSNTASTDDNLSCECASGFMSAFGNDSSATIQCTACSGVSQAVTTDGRGCINCLTSDGAEINQNNRCQCSDATQSLVERFENGTYRDNAVCNPCTGSYTGPATDNNVCSLQQTASPCAYPSDGVCLRQPPTTTFAGANSGWWIETTGPAAVGGCGDRNLTACQVLANLCVLENYAATSEACLQYATLYDTADTGDATPPRKAYSPWLYFGGSPGTAITVTEFVLRATDIDQPFAFKTGNTALRIVVATFNAQGEFLGYDNAAETGVLQICPDKSAVKQAAFVFGTTYQSTCAVPASVLRDSATFPTLFYEVYLAYTDASGEETLFPVPVLIRNTLGNSGNDIGLWTLLRRFMIVDNLKGIQAEGELPQSVVYASQLNLNVILQDELGTGRIYPPYLEVVYADVSDFTQAVSVSFSITYAASIYNSVQGLIISLSTLGTLSVIYSFFEVGAWRRRQGLQFVEGSSIFMFIFFTMGNLANIFFLVWVSYSAITLLIFKGQDTVTLVAPDDELVRNYVIFIAVAFAFKCVEMVGVIIMQSTIDVFLIDWEKPKVGSADEKISIWRTYFIANEWNEIQTCRKVSFGFQLFASILFIEVIGFKDFALETPDSTLNRGRDQYLPEYNPILRFAVVSLTYFVLDLLQIIYNVAIHERFIHDPIREFVDLCSVSNVSVFLLQYRHYGYYIHGRSVHGKADTDMHDMHEMLKREEENLTAYRGLETGSDCQTFEIGIPLKFRLQYDKIYQPLQLAKNHPPARSGISGGSVEITESVNAYQTMRNLLVAFLDHSLRDLDYFVKDKLFLENVFDMEFQEPIDVAYFYTDTRNAFTNSLFYGREFLLASFEILLLGVVDYGTENFALAAIVTFIVVTILKAVRDGLGRNNLAKKTLVDERFLI